MIKLCNIVSDILNENLTEKMINDSIKFSWKNNKYYWVNDKDGSSIDTSMTKRDENNKAKYSFTEFVLPRTGVVSYNLYNIKSFYVTQALKHNKVKRYLSPDEKEKEGVSKKTYELTPDKSIEEFKDFTAKYMVRILQSKGLDIDVILSPQSSSNFNADMINRTANFYQKITNKKVFTIPNAFIKNPKDIKVDTQNVRSNIKKEVQTYFKPNTPSDEVEKFIDFKIKDLYKQIEIWKVEEDIQPVMKEIYDLWIILEKTKEKRMWNKNKDKVLLQISMEIRNLFQYIEDNFGINYLETKYFFRGSFKPEEALNPWQIKHLSDGVRKSIYNIFKLTENFDYKYSYKQNDNVVHGVSKLINRLARNNKTILIFDDNLSSGATLDDACYSLINNGVNKDNIVVITLGKVPTSEYRLSDLIRSSKYGES